jgi:transcriptional regulator with XRE-family HTH domain
LPKRKELGVARVRSVLAPAATPPDEPYKSVRLRVSEKLREKRKSIEWTLERLAAEVVQISKGEIASISTAHLSRIENNLARPSDEELYWINKALMLPLGPIMEDEPEAPWHIVRRHKVESQFRDIVKHTILLRRHHDAHKKMVETYQKYRYVPLDVESGLIEPDDASTSPFKLQYRVSLMEIDHSERPLMYEEGVLDEHSGQEALFCLEGEVEFWFRSPRTKKLTSKKLEPGDFVRFDSRQPHGFRSTRSEAARALHIFADHEIKQTEKVVEVRKD